jgi:hypothetical protein
VIAARGTPPERANTESLRDVPRGPDVWSGQEKGNVAVIVRPATGERGKLLEILTFSSGTTLRLRPDRLLRHQWPLKSLMELEIWLLRLDSNQQPSG